MTSSLCPLRLYNFDRAAQLYLILILIQKGALWAQRFYESLHGLNCYLENKLKMTLMIESKQTPTFMCESR